MPTDAFHATAVAGAREWQMAYGERFALEGLLGQLKPRLAIETGTAQGGSLRRLAAHAEEVHAFDLVPETKTLERELPNATVHVGDSAETLPRVLAELGAAARHVDFALIDGDHTAAGVQRDARALLEAADACARTIVVFHDTANADVRAGLEELDLPAHPRVATCLLDFVPGYLTVPDHPGFPLQGWNGLGLVVLGEHDGPAEVDEERLPVTDAYAALADQVRSRSSATPPGPEPAHAPVGGFDGAAVALAALAGGALGAALGRLSGRGD
jgi:hypothetical protein